MDHLRWREIRNIIHNHNWFFKILQTATESDIYDYFVNNFNITLFVRYCLTNRHKSLDECHFLALEFGLDINQPDPQTGRTIAHAIARYGDNCMIERCWSKGWYSNIFFEKLDNFGFAPYAYNKHVPATNYMKWEMEIKLISSELYDYLFVNKEDDQNIFSFEIVLRVVSLMFHFDVNSRISWRKEWQREKFISIRDDYGNTFLHWMFYKDVKRFGWGPYFVKKYPEWTSIKNCFDQTPFDIRENELTISSFFKQNIEIQFFFTCFELSLEDNETFLTLMNERDHHGNSLLHAAVKFENTQIVNYIYHAEPDLINVSNNEGYLPLDYCQSIECLDILQGDDHLQNFLPPLPKRVYFGSLILNNYYCGSDTVLIYKQFPELNESLSLSQTNFKTFTCLGLGEVMSYIDYFEPDYVKLISTYARDHLNNTLWHHFIEYYNSNLFGPFESYSYAISNAMLLDPNVINERNFEGNTPHHLTRNEKLCSILESYGCDSLRMDKNGYYVKPTYMKNDPLPLQYIILFELYKRNQHEVLKDMIQKLKGSRLEKMIRYILPL